MGSADKVAGESEIEIENVPYLVTDEGYKVARPSIGWEEVNLRSTYIHSCIAYIVKQGWVVMVVMVQI